MITPFFKTIVLFSLLLITHLAIGQVEGANFALAGFATETTGTTGGRGGKIDTVTTGSDLQTAIINHKNSTTPLTIVVEGTINLENSGELDKIEVKEVNNLSILGSAKGAEFEGIGIKIRRVSNLIIRNISVHHVVSGEKDCIGIEGPADHIWIDHCELYNEYGDIDGDGDEDDTDKDFYDGLLDVKKDAHYITYSWNYLHGSWKTSLVGSSETDTFDRKITMHHNYYENCYSRVPLFRGGTGHIFNCYYHNIFSTCVNSRINACIRVEKNYFENAQNPWVSAYSDILGSTELIDNVRVNSLSDFSSTDTFEPNTCVAEIPYWYDEVLHEAEDVKNIVSQYSGVGKLDDPAYFETLEKGGTTISSKTHITAKVCLYPNPARDFTTVKFYYPEHESMTIRMVNLSGTIVYQTQFTCSVGQNTVTLPISELPQGLYQIQIGKGNSNLNAILVKTWAK